LTVFVLEIEPARGSISGSSFGGGRVVEGGVLYNCKRACLWWFSERGPSHLENLAPPLLVGQSRDYMSPKSVDLRHKVTERLDHIHYRQSHNHSLVICSAHVPATQQ